MGPADLESEAQLLQQASATLFAGFDHLPGVADRHDRERIATVLNEAALRLRRSYPFHHPLYAGQMLKPPHPLARLAHALAQQLNPNNHALDGGPESSLMEKEAVAQLAAMIGWDTHLGHLTGGGTLANLEALWVASRLHPGKRVVASAQAHYTHARLAQVLGIPFASVAVDGDARLDTVALEQELRRGDVGTIVATLGTTALGAVDPLPELLRLRERYGCRIHVDAAYGGYFVLAEGLAAETSQALTAMRDADSCVIDPHKHGLQPYGCGCVLFRDPTVGRFYRHDSPYTYFSSAELHLGEISLECSRPGAAAVALWATQRLLPLQRGGEFADGLSACRGAATELYRRLLATPAFLAGPAPALDIVTWAPAAACSSEIARRSRRLFESAARHDLHLSLTEVPAALLRRRWDGVEFDTERVTCLRSCLIKHEHREWLDEIWTRLVAALREEESNAWK
jgi:tyrosine decarboxylase / aspartate 1-decarboxylase